MFFVKHHTIISQDSYFFWKDMWISRVEYIFIVINLYQIFMLKRIFRSLGVGFNKHFFSNTYHHHCYVLVLYVTAAAAQLIPSCHLVFQIPTRLLLWESLPRNAMGKVI